MAGILGVPELVFGLFFPSIPLTVSNMGLLTRTLALLCSFLLALPSGWCCMIGLPCCQHREAAQTRAAATPKRCCCHHPTEQKPDGRTPAPKPGTRGTGCSCAKASAVAPKMVRLAPDLFVASLQTPAESHFLNTGNYAGLCRSFEPPRSFLYLSHCAWLC